MSNELIKTELFKEMGYKFEYFNPFQSMFYPEYDKDTNVVVSAPTGGGKTVVAEMAIYNSVIKKNKRAIFLGPMRALAKEKYDDWTNENCPFAEYKCSILTGDFKLTDAKKKELAESKIILMTSEMLDSRSRRMRNENNQWLLEVDVLIVDESHIIGMWNEGALPLDERGHRLECALMRFTKLNPNSRIILLSATLPNLPELGEWLTKLNGKQTNIIVSDWKPQPVDWHCEEYIQSTGYGSYYANKQRMFEKGLSVLEQYQEDMWLIFCHSKVDGRNLQTDIEKKFGFEVPFHSADLEKGERFELENSFKNKSNKIMIATSTLAYGMNLPARRVMIFDSKRGLKSVHPYDIKQMGGRAGRPGIDPRGDVHWIVGNKESIKCQESINNLPKAVSLMNDIDVFAFHIVAEIAEGDISTEQEIITFFDRTLASHQGVKLTPMWIKSLVDKLIEFKAIKKENDKLIITPLGKIASWLYFSPFDIYYWYDNFNKVFSEDQLTDVNIAWAWTSIRANQMDYIPKECKNMVDDFYYEFKQFGNLKKCEAAIIGVWSRLRGLEPKDIPATSYAILRNLIFDIERYTQAILLIDEMYARWDRQLSIKKIAIRISYGVDWDAAELCILPGIGKKRAEKLIENNIKSLSDFISKRDEAEAILGSAIFEKAYEIAKENVEDM